MSALPAGPAELIEPNAGSQALRDSHVINTLGGLLDRNIPGTGAGDGRVAPAVSDRVIADGRTSGSTAISTTIGHVFGPLDPFEVTVRDIARWDAIIRGRDQDLLKVFTAADIRRAKRENKIGVIYATQNLLMLGADVTRVDLFHDLGMRVFQLTYNEQNPVGAGCLAPDDTGLTTFGREVVGRLNELNAIVDLSHASERTCLDAVSVSSQPIAITHTGCRALVDVPRNVTDEQLRRVAASGGYIGIYLMPFLTEGRNATSEDVARHIEHAIDVAGEDAVGIGTDNAITAVDDWDAYVADFAELIRARRRMGISAPGEREDILPMAIDLRGPDQLLRLADVLYSRGHSEQRIRKILGENFLRYTERVWGS